MLILTAFAEILATREKLCGNEENFEKKLRQNLKKSFNRTEIVTEVGFLLGFEPN
jgi:hypothetical protein